MINMMSDREAVQLWRRVRNGSWPLSVFNKSRFVVVNSVLILYALSLFCQAGPNSTITQHLPEETISSVFVYICNCSVKWIQARI